MTMPIDVPAFAAQLDAIRAAHSQGDDAHRERRLREAEIVWLTKHLESLRTKAAAYERRLSALLRAESP